MVFFTCNGCGTSLKKNQVEKHQFQCKRSHHLSCMDCSKDFFGQEHKSHVKCITEEEKYSAKGYVAKPSQNKNERKQAEWVAMVQNLVQTVGNTNEELSGVLQRISQHENIPRKKPKFMNFLKSLLGPRLNPRVADQAWDLISKALEEQLKAFKAQNEKKQTEPDASTDGNLNEGKKRKNYDKENPFNGSKKTKKDNEETQNSNTLHGQHPNNTSISEEGIKQSAKVKWCTIGKTILRAEDDKELSLKKFQKKIIAEYLNRVGNAVADESVEILWCKCQKKLAKNPKFKIQKDRIKLVS